MTGDGEGSGAASAAPTGAARRASSEQGFLPCLRLGWAMAECRGRYRIGDDEARLGLPPQPPLARTDNALPLSGERSAAEQRIEAEAVLRVLADDASVDPPCSDLTGQPAAVAAQKASARLTQLAKELEQARRSGAAGAAEAAWRQMADLFYAWDAHVQDALAARSFGTSSAYQLGRGLAEAFWALDPTAAAPDDARGWGFLLGPARRTALTRLLDRLAPQLPALTADAVSWSLQRWSDVAADAAWRGGSDAIPCLAQQARVWRDLLLTGREPAAMVDSGALLRRARNLWPVVRSFLPEVGILALSVGILSGAAALLGGHNSGHAEAAALAVLGATGISGAGLAAKAKDSAHQVLDHLRTELNRDVVRTSVTILPPLPSSQR